MSLGVGFQAQYSAASLTSGLGATPALQSVFGGNGWGFGGDSDASRSISGHHRHDAEFA